MLRWAYNRYVDAYNLYVALYNRYVDWHNRDASLDEEGSVPTDVQNSQVEEWNHHVDAYNNERKQA